MSLIASDTYGLLPFIYIKCLPSDLQSFDKSLRLNVSSNFEITGGLLAEVESNNLL